LITNPADNASNSPICQLSGSKSGRLVSKLAMSGIENGVAKPPSCSTFRVKATKPSSVMTLPASV
jgi:hypothetical protein